MGMMEEWNFSSAADFAAFGAPDFPDVHRGWVRREWVSGSQGLINAGELRMRLPRLYDYGGIGHCGLFPGIPYEVCGEEYEQLTPSDPTKKAVVHVAPAQVIPVNEGITAVQVWGAVMGVALIGIVAVVLL